MVVFIEVNHVSVAVQIYLKQLPFQIIFHLLVALIPNDDAKPFQRLFYTTAYIYILSITDIATPVNETPYAHQVASADMSAKKPKKHSWYAQ